MQINYKELGLIAAEKATEHEAEYQSFMTVIAGLDMQAGLIDNQLDSPKYDDVPPSEFDKCNLHYTAMYLDAAKQYVEHYVDVRELFVDMLNHVFHAHECKERTEAYSSIRHYIDAIDAQYHSIAPDIKGAGESYGEMFEALVESKPSANCVPSFITTH